MKAVNAESVEPDMVMSCEQGGYGNPRGKA